MKLKRESSSFDRRGRADPTSFDEQKEAVCEPGDEAFLRAYIELHVDFLEARDVNGVLMYALRALRLMGKGELVHQYQTKVLEYLQPDLEEYLADWRRAPTLTNLKPILGIFRCLLELDPESRMRLVQYQDVWEAAQLRLQEQQWEPEEETSFPFLFPEQLPGLMDDARWAQVQRSYSTPIAHIQELAARRLLAPDRFSVAVIKPAELRAMYAYIRKQRRLMKEGIVNDFARAAYFGMIVTADEIRITRERGLELIEKPDVQGLGVPLPSRPLV